MAKRNQSEQVDDEVVEATAEESVFTLEKLEVLRLGSVDVPVIEDGKGFFKTITQKDWNLTYQKALLAYWEDRAKENPGFNVESKKAKLFM